MKLIFLDIDGVLCTPRSHVAQNGCGTAKHLDREGVGLLNRLATSDTQYVLSSTWRLHYCRAYMEEHLRDYGWRGQFHKQWRTPNHDCSMFGSYDRREREIEDWMNAYGDAAQDSFVIFDDVDIFSNLQEHFVYTPEDDGITWANFKRAARILHGGNWARILK